MDYGIGVKCQYCVVIDYVCVCDQFVDLCFVEIDQLQLVNVVLEIGDQICVGDLVEDEYICVQIFGQCICVCIVYQDVIVDFIEQLVIVGFVFQCVVFCVVIQQVMVVVVVQLVIVVIVLDCVLFCLFFDVVGYEIVYDGGVVCVQLLYWQYQIVQYYQDIVIIGIVQLG